MKKNKDCDFCKKMRKKILNYTDEHLEKMKKIKEIFDISEKIKKHLFKKNI